MTAYGPAAVAAPAALTRRLPMRYAEFRRAAFGPTLRRHRTTWGLSRQTLAALVGLTPADIAAIEDDELMPTLDTVFALADGLGTDAAELLHDTRTETERMIVEDWLRQHPHADLHGAERHGPTSAPAAQHDRPASPAETGRQLTGGAGPIQRARKEASS